MYKLAPGQTDARKGNRFSCSSIRSVLHLQIQFKQDWKKTSEISVMLMQDVRHTPETEELQQVKADLELAIRHCVERASQLQSTNHKRAKC